MELPAGRLRGLSITVIIALLTVPSYGQDHKPFCSTDILMSAQSCQLSIEAMSDILKDIYGGNEDRANYCTNKLERCVQAVQTGVDHLCPNIDPGNQAYHGQVDALRGFCQHIDVYQTYKSCVDGQQEDGLRVCRNNYFQDKQNFSRTEFQEGHFGSEYERRNGRCGLERSFQKCNEDVIYAQCRDYFPYFKDYQVALLSPYCRQLYQLTSPYVSDDPNTAVATVSSNFHLAAGALLFASFLAELF